MQVHATMMSMYSQLQSSLASTETTLFKTLESMGGEIRFPHTAKRHAFLDRGANVLAVAHVDTVQRAWGKSPRFAYSEQRERVLMHPNLDDRLGVFTIMYLLPALGIPVDVLLTDFEESGRSTSEYFTTDKQYKWIVQFDRTGEDVVLYDYEYNQLGDEWVNAIKDHGFKIGFGSFSCISSMEELGLSAMNVGIGYHSYHSKNAYTILDEYYRQIARFRKFYAEYGDTLFEYEPGRYTRHGSYGSYGSYGKYGDYAFSPPKTMRECYLCGFEYDLYCPYRGQEWVMMTNNEGVEFSTPHWRYLCGWCADEWGNEFTNLSECRDLDYFPYWVYIDQQEVDIARFADYASNISELYRRGGYTIIEAARHEEEEEYEEYDEYYDDIPSYRALDPGSYVFDGKEWVRVSGDDDGSYTISPHQTDGQSG